MVLVFESTTNVNNKMKIQISEGKTDRPSINHDVVRVFFSRSRFDNGYGFFIPENLVYAQLEASDRELYSEQGEFIIDDTAVEDLQDAGCTYPPIPKHS